MDFKQLLGNKRFRVGAAAAGAFIVLGGAAAAAAAALAPSTAVINGCFDKKNGALRVIDPAREACTNKESAISWNQQGPIGPAGVTGATGRDGRDGLAGITGASGPTGATGPQGVQGAQGVPGVAGPQGATGAQGPAGSGSGGGTVGDSTCSGANGVAYVVGQDQVGAMFAKIDDIKGESLDAKHKDEIEVQSFTWGGISNSGQVGAGGGAAKSKACPANVLKIRTDRATPLILKAAASGTHIKEATVSLVKGGALPYTFASYTFSDVLITSGGDSFNFIFGKVEVTYTPLLPDGSLGPSVTFGWDFNANEGI